MRGVFWGGVKGDEDVDWEGQDVFLGEDGGEGEGQGEEEDQGEGYGDGDPVAVEVLRYFGESRGWRRGVWIQLFCLADEEGLGGWERHLAENSRGSSPLSQSQSVSHLRYMMQLLCTVLYEFLTTFCILGCQSEDWNATQLPMGGKAGPTFLRLLAPNCTWFALTKGTCCSVIEISLVAFFFPSRTLIAVIAYSQPVVPPPLPQL